MAEWARITRFEDRPEGVDAALKQFHQTLLPGLQKASGYKGALVFIDRAKTRGTVVTLWDSEEAMEQSEDRAALIRAQATEQQGAAGLTLWTVDRCELLSADFVGLPQGTPRPAATKEVPPLRARLARPHARD